MIKIKRYLAIFIIAFVVLGITARAFCYEAEVTDISRTKYFPAAKEMLSKAGGIDISGDVYNRVISIQRKLKLTSLIEEKLSSFKKKLKQKFYSIK